MTIKDKERIQNDGIAYPDKAVELYNFQQDAATAYIAGATAEFIRMEKRVNEVQFFADSWRDLMIEVEEYLIKHPTRETQEALRIMHAIKP